MRKLTIILVASLGVTTLAGGVTAYRAWEYRSAAVEAQARRDTLIDELGQARAEAAESASRAEAAESARIATANHVAMLILSDAGHPPDDAHAISSSIRDYVYRTNVVGSGKFSNAIDAYANLGRPGFEQLRGGMSATYAWALNAAGVPARTVQLAAQSYLVGERRGDTHVTVEVFVNGAWRISDPTFNLEFDCTDGEPALDTEGARQCILRGGSLAPTPGPTQIMGRTIADYYAPFEKFLAAYEVQPYSNEEILAPQISYPSIDWRQHALEHYP